MKFLHLSDLHIGKTVHGFSMVEDQRYAFGQIYDYIDEYRPQAVILAGDIYDRSVPTVEAVELFDEFLTVLVEKRMKIFIISGNHDSAGRLSFGSEILKRAEVYVQSGFEGEAACVTLTDEWGEICVYLLPFIKPSDVRAAYKERVSAEELEAVRDYNSALTLVMKQTHVDRAKRNILVAHQFLTGSKTSESEDVIVGGLDNVDAAVFGAFDYVALGHLHSPQKVGTDTIRYSGTLLPYSFSERTDQKSAVLVEFGKEKQPKLQELSVKPLHFMKQVEGTLEELLAETPSEDYVKAVITDKKAVADPVARLREQVFPNLMLAEFSGIEKEQQISIEHAQTMLNMDPVSLFSEFYKSQNGEDMSKEEYERICRIYDEVRK